MNFKKIFMFLLVISVLSHLACLAATQNTESIGLGVSYLGKQIYVAPGTEFNGFFEVKNNQDEPQIIKIGILDWDRDLYGNERYYIPEKLPHSLAKYLSFYPSMMELGGGEIGRVNFSVKTEEPGCHWILFFVEGSSPIPKGKIKGEGEESEGLIFESDVFPAMGIVIWQIDPTDEIKSGKIVGMEVEQHSEQNSEGEEILVKILFENNGTVPLISSGWLELRDANAETIATVDIGWFRILPYGARRFLEIPVKIERKLRLGEKCLVIGMIDFGAEYLIAGQKTFTKGGN